MKNMIAIGAAAIITAALATPAAAAVSTLGNIPAAGTYTGTSFDGSTLSFTVSVDSSGYYAITRASLSFSAACKPASDDYTFNGSWSFALDSEIEESGKTTFSSTNPYYVFDVTLEFLYGADTICSEGGPCATGTITSYSPTLYPDPVTSKPTKALFCETPKYSLTLTGYTAPAVSDKKAAAAPHILTLSHTD